MNCEKRINCENCQNCVDSCDKLRTCGKCGKIITVDKDPFVFTLAADYCLNCFIETPTSALKF